MHTDEDFLRKLLENPADDTIRLVYADWLDEQGEAVSKKKSEFLRLTVRLTDQAKKAGWRKARLKELGQLAADLDTDWLAVVSKLKIENCGKEGQSSRRSLAFNFVCDKRWDELAPTEGQAIRFCEQCKNNVHYCETITEARNHAWEGHCIAVDLGIIRRDRDLEPRYAIAGWPSPEYWQREEERLRPDPVSEERERRKQAQSTDQPTTGDSH